MSNLIEDFWKEMSSGSEGWLSEYEDKNYSLLDSEIESIKFGNLLTQEEEDIPLLEEEDIALLLREEGLDNA